MNADFVATLKGLLKNKGILLDQIIAHNIITCISYLYCTQADLTLGSRLKNKIKQNWGMKSLNSVPSGKDRLEGNIKKMKTQLPLKQVRRKELNQIDLMWTSKSKL